MPRRKVAREPRAIEILPPEENDQPKVREIKHKTEWIEVAPVEETPEGDDDIEETEIDNRPRKKNKNAIQEMRKRLRAQGVTPSSNLRLYIERYVHSETDAGGSWAETEFCTKYGTTEEHIVSKDYIDAARKWGPGKYRITIRMDNRIVDAFDERISAQPSGPIIQSVNPNDPTSPQFIVQMPEGVGAQLPGSVIDPLKQMREAAKFYKEMKQTFEPEGAQSAQQQRSEEEILASAIMNRPEVVDTLVGSVLKRAGAKGDSDEPWYADVVRDAVKSGQLVQVVSVAIDRIFNGFSGMFPGRQNNGQTPMAQTPIQDQAQSGHQQQSQLVPGQEVGQVATPTNSPGNVAGDVHQNSPTQTATPEDQALQLLIEHCRRNIPAEIACDRLISFADAINDEAPHLSIDKYISIFAMMPVEAALEFVKSQPNGEAVVSLPHAQTWTAELQRLIKEAGQEGEE